MRHTCIWPKTKNYLAKTDQERVLLDFAIFPQKYA